MPLRKIGKYYYIDIQIKGENKRIRESLGAANRTEALERYKISGETFRRGKTANYNEGEMGVDYKGLIHTTTL